MQQTDKVSMKTRKLSIRSKFRIATILMLLQLAAVLLIVSRIIISSYMINDAGNSAKNIASIIANHMNGDELNKIHVGDENTPGYQSIAEALREYQVSEDIMYIYTMRLNDTNEIEFVVDADSEEPAAIGELYEDTTEAMLEAFEGQATKDGDVSKDKWGSSISAYAPYYNTSGELCGIVGIDYNTTLVMQKVNNIFHIMLSICIFFLTIIISVTLILTNQFTKALRQVNNKLAEVAYSEGDLTQKIDIHSGDEVEIISNNLNALLEKTRMTIEHIISSSTIIREDAEKMNQSIYDVTSSIGEISSAMEEMAASTEETTASINAVLGSSDYVDTEVSEIYERTNSSLKLVSDIEERSIKLTNAAKASYELVAEKTTSMKKQLEKKIEQSKSVEQITVLTDAILNIAEQTNMLALNANIEAARAGEQGRGFAIVANEINQLATSSGNTASEIQKISNEVIISVNELSTLATDIITFLNENILSEFKELVVSGQRYGEDANEIRTTMERFTTQAETLKEKVSSMNSSLQIILESSEQNTKAITDVTGTSININEAMQVTSSVSSDNNACAEELFGAVSQYKV